MMREFSLEGLEHLDDGRVLTAWKMALQRAIRDCEDRPGVSDARKVILELSVIPKLDEEAIFKDVDIQFQIKDTVPIRKSAKYNLDVRRGVGNQRQLVFNDLSEDNVHQRTLDELEEEGE